MRLANARVTAGCIGLLLSIAGPLPAQKLSESPVELVRRTVDQEVKAGGANAKFMFLDRKETARGSQTKLIAETEQGTAGMLIAVNDKPLTTEQQQEEQARLDRLMNSPEELQKKKKAEREDAERTTKIMNALPEAFIFEPAGTEPGTASVGRPSVQLVRLNFRPNPRYTPPSRVEQVLTGMQGYLLLDADAHRIAKIDGTLLREVSFGWGILGHLDKGGRFLVEQADVGNNHWEVSRMLLRFTGKELLFKGLSIKSDEVCSNFRPVSPKLTFREAVDLLKKGQAEMADNRPVDPQ